MLMMKVSSGPLASRACSGCCGCTKGQAAGHAVSSPPWNCPMWVICELGSDARVLGGVAVRVEVKDQRGQDITPMGGPDADSLGREGEISEPHLPSPVCQEALHPLTRGETLGWERTSGMTVLIALKTGSSHDSLGCPDVAGCSDSVP